jgi:serine/threonine-protein kinase
MPNPGDQVDHYVITRPLGRGGEAAVFQGQDLQTGRPVVLKFFDPTQLGEIAAYERFRREVTIGRLLHRPGIPAVLDVREDAKPPYLVLEYMEGQSLRTILQDSPRLPVPRALQIITNLAELVAYCHEQHVYHRDLKPENILVDTDGSVRIIDFGIALLDGAPRVTWRGFSGLVGTPEYMAPEQIRGERGGPQTDVYALGLILYELLAGHPPFHSPNPLSTMYQHLNMNPEPLRKLRSDVPDYVAAIVAKAMRRRKEERFANAGEFVAALRNPEQVDLSILDRPDPPLSSPMRESVIKNPLFVLGMIAVGTAVAVLVAEALLRR